jgi:hypothetical protein
MYNRACDTELYKKEHLLLLGATTTDSFAIEVAQQCNGVKRKSSVCCDSGGGG